MLSYCLKCRKKNKKKKTESKNPQVVKTKNIKIMLLSKSAVCNSKKSEFIKEKQVGGLLRQGIITTLSKTLLVGPLLYKSIKWMK